MPEKKSTKSYRRYIYTTAPLLLLILCLVGINLVNWWRSQPSPATEREAETAVSTQLTNQSSDTQATAISPTMTASPLPAAAVTPSATPYVPPTFPADTNIQLLGPPDNSLFPRRQPLSLYWRWPLPLAEDQFFAVAFIVDDNIFESSIIDEPNLGTNFQWRQNLETLPITTERIQWQVRLFSMHSDTPLLVSEIRSFSLQ